MPIRYVETKESIYDSISSRIRLSYPNSCVCWIEENDNKDLYDAYELRKSDIMSRRSSINEATLFHGTKENNVTNIATNGFDPLYNKTSAYGKGTYFAKDASYSMNYMHPNSEGISFMFVCSVLLGTSCIGSSNLRIDTDKYDSAVDRLTDPSIVVTPYKDACYPKYIVAFHKGAK